MSSCLLSLRRVIFWIVKWVPVVFIAALIFWSYYAYVVELNIRTIDSYHEKIPFLIIYHVIFILFLATYYQATFVTIKNPPKQFELSVSDIAKLNSLDNHSETRRQLEIFSKDLPLLTRNFDGEIRYCNICNCIKPDRCHHCSICGQCVLKMDHHCPWINNCVGYSNYKFFVLFLFYAFVYCLWVTSTTMKYFIKFWTNNLPDGGGKFHILFVFFTSSMFALSVSSLLFYHLWLTSKNRSTLESFRAPIFATAGPDANGFNLGWRENFKEIFGNDKFLALLPIRTSRGDGSSYPSRVYHRLASRTSQLPNSSVTNQSFNENNISNNSNSNKRDGGDSPVHPNHHNNNNNNNYENSFTGNGISFTSHYEKRQDISDLIATSNNPDYHTRLI